MQPWSRFAFYGINLSEGDVSKVIALSILAQEDVYTPTGANLGKASFFFFFLFPFLFPSLFRFVFFRRRFRLSRPSRRALLSRSFCCSRLYQNNP